MAFEEPALRWIVLALKFGPWRQELLRQWRVLRSRGVKRDRAASLASALAACFRSMCAEKSEVWTLNVGYQQCHVSGPLPLLHHLGLLRSARQGQPRALQLASKNWKRLLPTSSSRAQLEKWIAVADEVGELGSPRTCREWVDAHVRVHNIIVKHKVRGLRGRCLVKL